MIVTMVGDGLPKADAVVSLDMVLGMVSEVLGDIGTRLDTAKRRGIGIEGCNLVS